MPHDSEDEASPTARRARGDGPYDSEDDGPYDSEDDNEPSGGATRRATTDILRATMPCREVRFEAGTPLGLSLTAEKSGWTVVSRVAPGSAAEARGCKVGGVIVEINGTSIVGLQQAEVLALIEYVARTLATFTPPPVPASSPLPHLGSITHLLLTTPYPPPHHLHTTSTPW